MLVTLVGMLILAHTLGPKRRGPVKDSPYESGMPVVGDTRRRFNIRFYVVAMLFLLFDVEVVFLWPWATLFTGLMAFGAANESCYRKKMALRAFQELKDQGD